MYVNTMEIRIYVFRTAGRSRRPEKLKWRLKIKVAAEYYGLTNRTVAAMDVLVPKVGELIGGSQREEIYDVIKQRMLELGLPLEPYKWYLESLIFVAMELWSTAALVWGLKGWSFSQLEGTTSEM